MPIDNSKYYILLLSSFLKEPQQIIHILEEAHFHVIQVGTPQEALEKIKSTPTDLILFDADINSQDTLCFIKELKNHSLSRMIPILLLTSLSDEKELPELLYDNIDFILKPFGPLELITRIQHQLLLLRAELTIRKQNNKLKQSLEARDKLYSVIAHDLRAPIGTIKMINSSIESQKAKIKSPEILKLFEMINETTEEAFNLLENLLRWTRNQNGKTKLYATHFNLSQAIKQIENLFTTIASAKNINIYNHALTTSHVYADEDMIKTVLRNLLSNAIKFTYPGGRIDIELTELEECVLISVKDNGKGIPKELQTKLLKPNEYITTYGTRNEKGSGLGLILCRDFIKMNKGKFWFTSQEGVGTTFYFTLPHLPADNQTAAERR